MSHINCNSTKTLRDVFLIIMKKIRRCVIMINETKVFNSVSKNKGGKNEYFREKKAVEENDPSSG